jgi:hypothetical protein
MDWMGSRAKGKSVDRLAGGKLKGCKERGEWAEMYFLMQAAGRGMKVLRPYGQTGVYDVGVDAVGRLQRVQVKSTIYKRRNGEYSLNIMGPGRKMYAAGTVDFFAVLLIPVDAWYIIPYEVIGMSNCSLHFTPRAKRQKYGEYLEAWELLRRTGLTIMACAEEFVAEGEGRGAAGVWSGPAGAEAPIPSTP